MCLKNWKSLRRERERARNIPICIHTCVCIIYIYILLRMTSNVFAEYPDLYMNSCGCLFAAHLLRRPIQKVHQHAGAP